MVKELHKRGYGKLQVMPSVSPNGMSWRCSFYNDLRQNPYPASIWLEKYEYEIFQDEIIHAAQKLADFYVKDNMEFIEQCKGKNDEYVKWYCEMVDNLEAEELPYAFDDYYSPTNDLWNTSKDKKIKSLPKEYEYFFKILDDSRNKKI